MVKKVKTTRTINPLHFEDLEPHRFEDLVRRLLYGFRDWTNIEPTGRAGSDEGFDVRAWERDESVTNVDDEGEEGTRDFQERLWQIQGKREKVLTPAKIRDVVEHGVSKTTPPYGYILAAATNISKASYDAFREELKKKGVVEFHFWGKDHLEDQLSLPQNDEILFTFFGLSLAPRRRSRIAELKFNVTNKNKLLKLIFGTEPLTGQAAPNHKRFLLRDIKAEHYPYVHEYPDFEKYRRWEEHDVVHVSSDALVFKIRECYAYLDLSAKEWDFSTVVDLVPRKHPIDQANRARLEQTGKKVERFWRHLPQRMQAKFVLYGIVRFEDVLIIDDRGDPEYNDPQIFVDFGSKGPFHHTVPTLVHNQQPVDLENLHRVTIFPASFPDPIKEQVHELEKLGLEGENLRVLKHLRGSKTLYSFDGRLSKLSVGSIIRIPGAGENRDAHAEVTHIYSERVGDLLEQSASTDRAWLQAIAGRNITDRDKVTLFEIHAVMMSWQGDLVAYLDNEW